MHPNSLPTTSTFLLLFSFLVAFIQVPSTLCDDHPSYTNCSSTITCGSVSNLDYPFWGMNRPSYCGQPGFNLTCQEGVPKIAMNGITFRVLEAIPSEHTLRVARDDYWNDYCPKELKNSTIDFNKFDYGPNLTNLTLFYGCLPSPSLYIFQYNCTANVAVSFAIGSGRNGFQLSLCRSNVIVPISETAAQILVVSPWTVQDALRGGFELEWVVDDEQCRNCLDSDGVCGYNETTYGFICFFRDQPSETTWSPSPTQGTGFFDSNDKLIIGLSVVAATTVVIFIIWLIVTRYKTYPRQQKTNANATVEAFVKEYGTLAPKRYSYTDIKKMTNKFKEKLGQGGFGSVYKGKLPDGRLVAVKLLSQSKGNGEDFMNEVASISRTSHVNVVTLLGFCYNGSKRALVFEFMPHGSLDKFIYNGRSVNQSRLEWKLLYDITFGIARGLEYLHQGCNTRILHFDIKPHNILLDERFCPKISDFGLSKLCERNESIVSMTGARGTIGFIAPEVFCRNFGGVSFKSDVYSYGMMVLEMVGGRKNVDVGVSQTSEIYFPSWIYNHVDQAMNLKLDGVTTEEEEKIARKLILVSLWCIQTTPSDRPSMTKVLEMLQGTLQALPIPPRPFVSSSPVRSPITSSTMSTIAMS